MRRACGLALIGTLTACMWSTERPRPPVRKDRVENGDYRVGKDGNLIRVPMSGRDLTTNAAIFFDKRQLHRNQPTVICNGGELTQEFADTFRDFARNSVFVDGEYRLIKPVDPV